MLYYDYEIIYYVNQSGRSPVKDYVMNLTGKEQAKIAQYIKLLEVNNAYLGLPYAKHIHEKIWELRMKYNNINHRILYFVSHKRQIVLLSAFIKKSKKTPKKEIHVAYNYYLNFINLL